MNLQVSNVRRRSGLNRDPSQASMLARFAEHWSPKKIAQINDYDVRIVKVQGEFT